MAFSEILRARDRFEELTYSGFDKLIDNELSDLGSVMQMLRVK